VIYRAVDWITRLESFALPDARHPLLGGPTMCVTTIHGGLYSKERPMANNKNPNQKQPGEKEPGKFHYNPGNMSGKTIGTNESQQRANADTKLSRREHKDQKR
jgi:hypothetical protein